MNTTKILGEAVGIQSQGIVGRTERQTKVGLTSAIIIGQFKRGRVDRPMTIHNGNIRGQLGHEPNNPYYNAVQDCLDTGVPSVQVLRVGGIDDENPPIISCDGATNQLDLSMSGNFPELSITVNEVTRVFADTGSPSDELENGGVGNSTPHIAELIEYMGVNYPDISIYLSCGGGLNFFNASLVTTYRISLACLDGVYFDWVSPDNPTAQLSNGNTVVSFCLAPVHQNDENSCHIGGCINENILLYQLS